MLIIQIVFVLATLSLIIYLIFYKAKKGKWKSPKTPFPLEWRIILQEKIDFYRSLSQEEKSIFEYKMQEFLLNCRITGIKTEVTTTDRMLVASSAVMPTFRFPNWRYTNLFGILLYPNHFSNDFKMDGEGRNILGMVGTGYMNGKMILSKQALHHGFDITNDKKNTAVHEFIHLIDKMDGNTDGVPKLLLEKPYIIPWLNILHKEIEAIYENKSDINPYGGTNKAEFFAVAGEYFFEKPKLLQSKHPKLYDLMDEIFNHNMAQRELHSKSKNIGRNDPCPCGSGEKFKKCCGK